MQRAAISYALLILSLALLVAGHWVAALGPDTYYSHWLPASGTHTAASVLVRMCSVPLRIWVCTALLLWLKNKSYKSDYELVSPHAPSIWALLSLYYCLDMALSFPFLQTTPFLLILSLMALLWPCGFYNEVAKKWSLLASFAGMWFFVTQTQAQTTDNNAFTIFGLQGLALCLAVFRRHAQARSYDFVVLAPALGYLAPATEKLMLNPLGWLSGASLAAYGHLYGYSLAAPLAAAVSILLLVFQVSMVLVLIRPRVALWVYPCAVVFHLISGLVLGFGTALNPWIIALIGAMGIRLGTKNQKVML